MKEKGKGEGLGRERGGESLALFYLSKTTSRKSKPLIVPSGKRTYDLQLKELFRAGMWHEVHNETVVEQFHRQVCIDENKALLSLYIAFGNFCGP